MLPLFGSCRHAAVRTFGLGVALLSVIATSSEAQRARRAVTRAQSATRVRATAPDTVTLIAQCSSRKASTCVAMSSLLLAGKTIPADTARAVSFLENACAAGDVRACTQAAWMFRKGRGLRADTAKALRLFTDACNRRDASACTSLGYMHEVGVGTPRDAAEAATLYDRACAGGDARGCGNLANLRDAGGETIQTAGAYSGARKATSSVSFLRTACGRTPSDGAACTNLGLLYETGRGVALSPARAVALYRRGCQDNVLEACLNLGKMIALGRGVATADTVMAARLFRQACDGNLAVACANLAVLQMRGRGGVPRDSAHAMVLFAKACTLNDSISCQRAKHGGKP